MVRRHELGGPQDNLTLQTVTPFCICVRPIPMELAIVSCLQHSIPTLKKFLWRRCSEGELPTPPINGFDLWVIPRCGGKRGMRDPAAAQHAQGCTRHWGPNVGKVCTQKHLHFLISSAERGNTMPTTLSCCHRASATRLSDCCFTISQGKKGISVDSSSGRSSAAPCGS